MTPEMWIAVGIGGAVLLGLIVLALFALVPNRALPTDVSHRIGDGARAGLLSDVIAGI